MSSLNKVMLIGNLTREPELKHLSTGTIVCDIGLAVNRTFMKNGQSQDDVTYIDITLWNKTAENTANYMSKGSSIFVEGRLQIDSWQDKNTGQNRSKLKVIGDRVQFLSSSNKQSNEFANYATNKNTYPNAPSVEHTNNAQKSETAIKENTENDFNDKVPF